MTSMNDEERRKRSRRCRRPEGASEFGDSVFAGAPRHLLEGTFSFEMLSR
jgi:hypothetical protein